MSEQLTASSGLRAAHSFHPHPDTPEQGDGAKGGHYVLIIQQRRRERLGWGLGGELWNRLWTKYVRETERNKKLNWDDVVKGCGSGLFSSQLFLSQTLDFFIVSDFHLSCQETKAKTKIYLMVPDEDTTELWNESYCMPTSKCPDLKSVMSAVTSSYFGETSRLKSKFSWSLDWLNENYYLCFLRWFTYLKQKST